MELRKITQQSGTAFIFDEVITGFRVHPAGAQGYFGIVADIASYGKVAGGGMPIGIIAGKKRFMDAFDGGSWQFGDASIPEVGVTYFAGTFVRFPLALAATKASLQYLKDHGPDVQKTLNQKTEMLVNELKQFIMDVGAPVTIKYFGSLFKILCDENVQYGELLFHLLRDRGIHAWDARPCFLTLAHTDKDIQNITKAFKDSVKELQAAGIYPESLKKSTPESYSAENPPMPGAKLGRDRNGKPAWFMPDPERPGKFIQVGEIQ
jgi:glutamate-1-semialdehyde aminotransferase